MNNLSTLAAVAANKVIGKDNKIPWDLPADLRYFKAKTLGNIVVMGRKTYQSIGKPLPGRINIVFSKKSSFEGVFNVTDVDSFFRLLQNRKSAFKDKEVFVIGGAAIFSLLLPYTDTLYLTKINHNFNGDTFFPDLDEEKWHTVSKRKGIRDSKNNYDFEFVVLKRRT